MLKKLLPLVLLLVGAGAGVGAGIFLREPNAASQTQLDETEAHAMAAPDDPHMPSLPMGYVKLNNQFVVPIVQDEKVAALVVLALSLEAPDAQRDAIYKKEPKLRDSFLQVLFDHANTGGFDGAFTEVENLAVLRNALREVAQRDMGEDVINDVLIIEIARQDY